MKGYAFDPLAKKMSFWRGAGQPTLILPDGVPVILLPTPTVINNHNAVYPDVPKSRATFWQMSATSNSFAEQWGITEIGRAYVTATPQEWSTTTILAPAPAGADVFAMQVRLNRIVAPTNHWPSGIAVATVQNQWIPLTGSILLEVGFGFARAMSIYISGGNLVLHQQQSVAVSPGGYGAYGNTSLIMFQHTSGGNTNGSGIPIYYGGDGSAPHYRRSDYTEPYPGVGWSPRHRHNGSQPPTTTDPTNIGSTWRIDLRGQFGRRS